MTSRGKSVTTRIEVEIERSREEGNWTRVIELAEQLKEKSREYGAGCFVLFGGADCRLF